MSDPTLESLRAEGLHQHDAVRFGYLEALARRLHDQPPAVQAVLRQRWQKAVEGYAERARAAPGRVRPVLAPARTSLLAGLNSELQARAACGTAHGAGRAPDLKSVRQFGEVWSKIAVEQQVAQALARGPENAGPLNSHKLMLRALRLMRALSPDYLRHFLAQMDALLWLEQQAMHAAPPVAKPVRKLRRKG